jgi:hypothetical protein
VGTDNAGRYSLYFKLAVPAAPTLVAGFENCSGLF